jgi:serine/threonine-protein kinase
MASNQPLTVLPMGTLVNERFRVKKLLGQGGYGNVYLVEDEARFFGNRYALKESLSSTTSEHRQFTREAKWLLELRHPNLPAVDDQFEWHSRPYFAMAYVDGENLEDRIDRLGPLPEEQGLGWIRPIAEAVLYLHSQKRPIIHRDIKPGNIILLKDGRPILVDFGISKVMAPALKARKTTRAARAVSGGYSPIEQYTRGGTDARSDVYALGATLYHLLTGFCPPEAPDIASGVTKLPAPSEFNPQITPQTERVILHAMRQKPEERFQTVREFLDALPGGLPVSTAASAAAASPPALPPASKSGKRPAGPKAPKAPSPPPVFPPAPAQAPATPSPVPVGARQLPASPPLASQAALPTADLASTVIARPPAQPAYAPPTPPPAKTPPPKEMAGARPTPAVPRQSTGTQEFALPSEDAVPSEKQPPPPRKRRIRWAAICALLCGLAVLGTIVLAIVASDNNLSGWYLTQYQEMLSGEWWVTALFAAIPVAALLLVFVPLFHWFGMLGRILTYCLLLLVPLLGLAPIIAWTASGQTDAPTRLFDQGFLVPCLLFGLTWDFTLWQIIRRK